MSTRLTLPMAQLKEFMAFSKFVPSDNSDLIPVLKYVKIEITFGVCYLTKANPTAFCRYSFNTDQEDCEWLIEESKLDLLSSSSKKDEFTITLKDNEIFITDGYFKWKLSMPVHAISEFPQRIGIDSIFYWRIDNPVLESIAIAKTYAGKDNLLPHFSAVYVGGYNSDEQKRTEGTEVYASAGNVSYTQSFAISLPCIAMTVAECDLISKFQHIDFGVYENMNIYRYENITYGFGMRVDARGYDYNFLLRMCKKSNYVTVNREDLVNFCSSTLKFSESTYVTSEFISNSNSDATLMYKGNEKNEESSIDIRIIKCVGEPFSFRFNPQVWLPVLKAMTYNEISLGNEGHAISLFNEIDKSYNGLAVKHNA